MESLGILCLPKQISTGEAIKSLPKNEKANLLEINHWSMGNSHCLVVNKTHKKLCLVTYNYADSLYTGYKNMYILDPGEAKTVEAIGHIEGLRVAIIYDATNEGHKLLCQRWKCKNASVLTVTFMNGGDISTFGDNTQSDGKGEIKERNEQSYAKAVEALTYQSPVTRAALKR